MPTLETHLQNPGSGWSMGSFGVVAEFHREPEEQSHTNNGDALSFATSRGAIRLDWREDAVPVSYETYRSKSESWSQGIALCLPESAALRGRRKVLADLGIDEFAVLTDHKNDRLFDLGVGALGQGCFQVEFCVRTGDPELISVLERNTGTNVFNHDSPVMPAVLRAHPHRIAITNLGRVEVFQKIGGPDTGDVSPEGPHTHLLPKLISSNRSHDANIPIPQALTPCGYLHPESPLVDNLGKTKPFDKNAFEQFQVMLEKWGDPTFIKAKQEVFADFVAGKNVDGVTENAGDRVTRAAQRIAVCQLKRSELV